MDLFSFPLFLWLSFLISMIHSAGLKEYYNAKIKGTQDYRSRDHYIMRGTHWPLRMQREVDSLDIQLYFRNERIAKLQIMCIFFNGPCDVLGRWAKARVVPGVYGICDNCTKHQKKMLPGWIAMIGERYPALFRAAFAQWLLDNGYPVPLEEVFRIQKTMGFVDPSIIFINDVIPLPNDTISRKPSSQKYIEKRTMPLFSIAI